MTIALCPLSSLIGLLLRGPVEEERPQFEKLLQLNSAQLFGGGEVRLEGDQLTIEYKKPGQFSRALEGTGIIDPEDIRGDGNKKILDQIPKKEGQQPVAAVIGRGDGDWQSRFELGGNVRWEFKLWIRSLQRGSALTGWLNRGSKSHIQTSFFQNATLFAGGKSRRTTAPKEYQASPEKWVDKKSLVPVEMSYQDGKLSVKWNQSELLSLAEGVELPPGRIAFSFRKLSFVISDVKVSGKIDRQWYEGLLKDLETRGALVLKEKPPASPPENPPRGSLKKDADSKAAREKDAEKEL